MMSKLSGPTDAMMKMMIEMTMIKTTTTTTKSKKMMKRMVRVTQPLSFFFASEFWKNEIEL